MINHRKLFVRMISFVLAFAFAAGFTGCKSEPAGESSSSTESQATGDNSVVAESMEDSSVISSDDILNSGDDTVQSKNNQGGTSGGTSVVSKPTQVIPTDLGKGTTYYVSSSDGNDNNNGLSMDKPFKTLDKINTLSLQPGDNILLKRGDTFKGQHLQPKGMGNKVDGQWITFDAYGTGNSPLLKGPNEGYAAISLSMLSAARAYRIRNIDIDGYQVGICSVKSSMDLAFDGLIIDNCNITNITENKLFDPNPALPEGAELCYGLRLERAKNVEVKNCNFNTTDCPIRVRGELMTFDNLDIRNSRIQGVMIYGSDGWATPYEEIMKTTGKITFKNSKIINTGYAGLYLGTAGMMIQLVKECLVQNVEIAYTTNTQVGDFDACAIDWEETNVNCTLDGVYAHDNDGPMLLAMEHTETLGSSRGNQVINCISINNGRRDHTAEGSFINHSSYFNANQKITVKNCIDIGKPGSVPYTYENAGNKQPYATLQTKYVTASNFISTTMDVYEQFNISGLSNWNNTEKASVSNAHLQLQNGAQPRTKYSGTDYTVSTYLKGSADLVFLENGSNGYVWSFSNGKVTAQKKSGGKLTKLKDISVSGLKTSEWFRVRVETAGNTIKTYINDVLVNTLNENSYTSGSAGIDAKGTAYADEFFIYRSANKTRQVETFNVADVATFGKLGVTSQNGIHGWHLPEINWSKSSGIGNYMYRPFFVGRADIKGANAYLQRDNVNINVNNYKTVSVLMNNLTTNGNVTLEYTTDGQNWNSKSFVTEAMSNDSYYPFAYSGPGFKRYYIDMSDAKGWNGTIKSVRLRFAATSGYISLKDVTISK